MTRLCPILLASLMWLSSQSLTVVQAALPPFLEVFEILRTNLVGLGNSGFEHQATEALLKQFGGSVIAANEIRKELAETGIVHRATYDRHYPYVRLGHLSGSTDQALAEYLADTNIMSSARGLVLDLRFAQGTDYAIAAKIAGLFAPPGQPLLDWGDGLITSTSTTNHAWSLPIAVLVNQETSGAAEALAAVLRETASGLVIGRRTAGKSGRLKEFPLSTGERLQLPVSPVKTGAGEVLPQQGLAPDIEVVTRVEHDKAWLDDPFTAVAAATNSLSATNKLVSAVSVRRRVNEAELVRALKAGKRSDTNDTALQAEKPSASTESRAVRDPVLGRALDLLKGLSLIRRR